MAARLTSARSSWPAASSKPAWITPSAPRDRLAVRGDADPAVMLRVPLDRFAQAAAHPELRRPAEQPPGFRAIEILAADLVAGLVQNDGLKRLLAHHREDFAHQLQHRDGRLVAEVERFAGEFGHSFSEPQIRADRV